MRTASSSAQGCSSRGSWSAGITAEVEEQADVGGRGHHCRNDNDGGYRRGHGGRGRGRGRRGGGVVGRAIKGVRRFWPSSWPSPSSTSAVVDIGHCHGRRLVGHCCGRLRCRHRPSSTSAIVAAVNEWDICGGGSWQKGEARI